MRVSRYPMIRYAILPTTLAGIAIATPFLLYSQPTLGFALQRAFALVCHQQTERSFFLFCGSVAVCARCLGIYLGAAVGLLLIVPRRIAMQFLIVAVVINVTDRLAESVGLHGNWMLARFVLGIAMGTAAAMFVVASSAIPTQAELA